ncbi:MAG: twin-arginine translocase TatA/TatE family subunit [Thermoleophilia bacterium]
MPLGLFQNVGVWEILILLLVLLLVFGPKRLPEMGRSLGRGMREFKDSITGKIGDDDDDQPALVTAAPTATAPAPAPVVTAEPVAAPAPVMTAEPAAAPAAAEPTATAPAPAPEAERPTA